MGGSSKKVTVGYKYYLGMQMALCHGPADRLSRIEVDDRIAWQGDSEGGSITIAADELFGGESREGGISGQLDIEMGDSTQGRNSYLQSQLGDEIPTFRGTACAVLRQVYFGLNPYLKPWKFRLQRIHKRQSGINQWYDEKSQISSPGLETEVIYLNIDANDFGVDQTDGVNIGPFAAEDIIRIEKPSQATDPNLFWDGWSAWISDDSTTPTPPPVVGQTWTNGFSVYAGGSTIYTAPVDANLKTTESEALSEIQSILPEDLTGHTNYIFYGVDPNIGDNRNGLSLKITRYFVSQLDMNPAHIIRECLTDPDWGMGYLDCDINDESFTEAADILFDEGMGISLLWDRQMPLQDFISEILRHIDASIYVDKSTGEFVLTLVRDDYSVSNLIVLDENNVRKIDNYSRTAFGEFVNQITVNFWNSDASNTGSVTVQDIALVQQQGSVIGTTMQYPGFTNFQIATRVAERDLRSLSSALRSCQVTADRAAAALNVGDVFILDWPDLELNDVVMRVQGVEYGDGKTNSIRVTAVEDVFSTPSAALINTPPVDWSPPGGQAFPSEVRAFNEAPYYEMVQILGQTRVDALLNTEPETGFVVMGAGRPSQGSSINARLFIDAGGGYQDSSNLDFSPYAYIENDISFLNTSVDLIEGSDIDQVSTGTFAQIGEEIVRVDAVNGALSIGRGCLDTVPAEHPAGTPIIFWDVYAGSDETEYVDGETVAAKVLTNSGSAQLNLAAAPEDTLLLSSRAIRPYPPGNLKVNGEYYPETIAGDAELFVEWSHRDREQQTAGTIIDTTAGDIGPEPGTTYTLRIYGENDTLGRTETGITGTDYLYSVSDEQDDFMIPGAGVVEDSLWSDVSLLLNLNGSDGGSVITDSSDNSVTVSNFGVTTESDQYKFGGSSGRFGGAQRLLIPFSADVNFTGVEFSIEAWIRLDANAGFPTVFDFRGNSSTGSSWAVYIDAAAGQVAIYDGPTLNTVIITPASSIPAAETWFHLAVSRSGTETAIYIDGQLEASDTYDPPATHTSGMRIGANNDGTGNVTGYMDDVRFTKAARYTGAFTPPTEELARYMSGMGYRVNGRLRFELEGVRDGYESWQFHVVQVDRDGYGFNYGQYYGGAGGS